MQKEGEQTRRSSGIFQHHRKSFLPFSAKGRTAGLPDLQIVKKTIEIKAQLQKPSVKEWEV